jgi:V8-like Glu-specific endopeptidase
MLWATDQAIGESLDRILNSNIEQPVGPCEIIKCPKPISNSSDTFVTLTSLDQLFSNKASLVFNSPNDRDLLTTLAKRKLYKSIKDLPLIAALNRKNDVKIISNTGENAQLLSELDQQKVTVIDSVDEIESHKTQLANLGIEIINPIFTKHYSAKSKTSIEVSPEETIRALACQKAVNRYRPKKRGGTRPRFKRAFMDACLLPIEKVLGEYATSLRSAIARVEGFDCNATILSPTLAITARHCFELMAPESEGCSRSSIANIVSSASLVGITQSGGAWKSSKLKVIADPFELGSPLRERLGDTLCMRPAAFDFVILSPTGKNYFPVQSQVRIPSKKLWNVLQNNQRLLTAWFDPGDKSMYVDDAPWCIVRVFQGNSWFEHHCQTIHGSSGTGIFRYTTTGELTLIGVHVSRSEHTKKDGHLGSNEAVLLPPALIEFLENKIRLTLL